MITVGVTGGIGSGKSTFCRFLKDLGAKVIYADELAREIMNTDLSVRSEIIQKFGDSSYTQNGINRSYLTDEAFNKGRIEELNAIVHPAVQKRLNEIMHHEELSGSKILVYEAAILLKNGRPNFIDKVVWIESPAEIRIQRVSNRDHVTANSVSKRISNQQSFESVCNYVDIVVNNSGDMQNLKIEAERVFNTLLI